MAARQRDELPSTPQSMQPSLRGAPIPDAIPVQHPGVQSLLRRVIAAALESPGATAAALLLYDTEHELYLPTAPSVAEGLDESWHRREGLSGVQDLARRAATVGDIVQIPDTAEQPELDLPLLQGAGRPRAVCAAPLSTGGVPVGVLIILYAQPLAEGTTCTLPSGVLALAEAAIASARSYERELTLRVRLEALDKATRALTSEMALDDVLQRIVEVAAELVGARYAALGVLGPDGSIVDFITTGLTPEERAAIGPLPQGHGLLGVLIREGKPLRVPKIACDPRRIGFPPHHPPMGNLLGVPIRIGKEVVGDLYLTNKRDSPAFSDDDQYLLELLAAHAGIAIENARLHAQEAEARRTLQHALESLRASEQRFAQAFHASPIASAILRSIDGATVDVNEAFLTMSGYQRADLLGKSFEDVGLYADATSARMLHDLLGQYGALHGQDLQVRTHTGALRTTLLSLEPVQMAEEPCLLATLVDITERKRAEDALRFLTDTDMVLASSLDYTDTLTNVARRAVPTLADWCSVMVLDDEGRDHRVAVAHAEPEKEYLVEALFERYTVDLTRPEGIGQALRRGETRILPHVSASDLQTFARDEEHLRLLRQLGMVSWMLVPMISHGETLGAISLMMAGSQRHYTPADRALAEDLARRAALAVANARLHAQVQEVTMLRERERISRDLHDGIIQDLYGTALQLESLADDSTEPSTHDHLMSLADAVSAVIGDIRTYIRALRARELASQPLHQGLAALVQEVRTRQGQEVTFLHEGETLPLPDSVAHALLQITREGLANVVKHAKATSARVVLIYGAQEVSLVISDDGRGFDTTIPHSSSHHGLANLYARAAELGATAEVSSTPGLGTTISIHVPVVRHRHAHLANT